MAVPQLTAIFYALERLGSQVYKSRLVRYPGARPRRGRGSLRPGGGELGTAGGEDPTDLGVAEPAPSPGTQRQFFDYAGPLFSVVISTASSTTLVNERRRFRARCRGIALGGAWRRTSGLPGRSPKAPARSRASPTRRSSTRPPSTPGLSRLKVSASQREVTCTAEALVTIADGLEASISASIVNARGLPGYTFERVAGEL